MDCILWSAIFFLKLVARTTKLYAIFFSVQLYAFCAEIVHAVNYYCWKACS